MASGLYAFSVYDIIVIFRDFHSTSGKTTDISISNGMLMVTINAAAT